MSPARVSSRSMLWTVSRTVGFSSRMTRSSPLSCNDPSPASEPEELKRLAFGLRSVIGLFRTCPSFIKHNCRHRAHLSTDQACRVGGRDDPGRTGDTAACLLSHGSPVCTFLDSQRILRVCFDVASDPSCCLTATDA